MASITSKRALVVIAGAGAGLSSAIARRFGQTYDVVVISRSQSSVDPIVSDLKARGTIAHGMTADVTQPESLASVFEKISALGQPTAAAIYNVSSPFSRQPFSELSLAEFEASLSGSPKGAFNFAQRVLPLLLATEYNDMSLPPTLLFTGATASFKGNAYMAAFAPAKWALRGLAQVLAREYGPQGVHIGCVNIDGVIESERSREYLKDVVDGKISPSAAAEAYWHLHTQPRSAWTWEMDVRPWSEKW
ncbi:uncharacterized protein V1510DRAFT_3781 [Dipodascopsis tothii]|uniref:uncharacterized protein n=1 Tax=Dipodascopsis tothii TaxID=44089 RepID=UPI0034CF65C2